MLLARRGSQRLHRVAAGIGVRRDASGQAQISLRDLLLSSVLGAVTFAENLDLF